MSDNVQFTYDRRPSNFGSTYGDAVGQISADPKDLERVSEMLREAGVPPEEADWIVAMNQPESRAIPALPKPPWWRRLMRRWWG